MSLEDELKPQIEEVNDDIRRLEVQLREFVSRDEVNQLANYAFEYSLYESRVARIPREAVDLLHIVRRYDIYQEAYDFLVNQLMENPHATKLKLIIPPLEDLYKSLDEKYKRNRP